MTVITRHATVLVFLASLTCLSPDVCAGPLPAVKAPPNVTTLETGPAVLPTPSRLDFSLDWTLCQMHRVNDKDPIKILLPGRITCDVSTVWTLAPDALATPALILVTDIEGQAPYSPFEIPLFCEISLDGHEFVPMVVSTAEPLSTIFPPGMHRFQVRMTGKLEKYQQPGYYRLQLAQNLVPQM